ncbi:MAG: methylglyoxal reductase (NADPH-dependent) gre2 [Chaenotheca gracillima]|nr:MAG: methylglyoxal reductase (NADPH-dependent) gre2 [Chaenotheca gracillima]
MDDYNYQTPDLASVLSTLAKYAPTASAQSFNVQDPDAHAGTVGGHPEAELEEGEYDPSEPILEAAHPLNLHGNDSKIVTALAGSNGEVHGRPQPLETDPTAITDWSSGLRYVMKTASRSDAIMARIRKMINVQHEHEKQWWAGRQDLIQRQKARVEGRKKLEDVLRTVGGDSSQDTPASTEEDNAREITMHNAKVYRASHDMVKAMSTEFKNLGIPFFGTQTRLVEKGRALRDSEDQSYARLDGRIYEDDLLKLQRKMVEMLEDLCRE